MHGLTLSITVLQRPSQPHLSRMLLAVALPVVCLLQVVAGDLDDPASLLPHLSRSSALYCHALSGDAASADPTEIARGRALADLLRRSDEGKQLQLVVYNSSAGRGCNAGISQVREEAEGRDAAALNLLVVERRVEASGGAVAS